MSDIERTRRLMMAQMDGEISELEERELRASLAANPALRIEQRRMVELGRRLAGFKIKDPADAVLADMEASLLARGGLSLGWLLLLAGGLLAVAWLMMAWLLDPELPAVLRWGGLAVFAGLFLLLAVKIRERWIERRSDPYRDVIR